MPARLSAAEVHRIADLIAAGLHNDVQIAAAAGIHPTTVREIRLGRHAVQNPDRTINCNKCRTTHDPTPEEIAEACDSIRKRKRKRERYSFPVLSEL